MSDAATGSAGCPERWRAWLWITIGVLCLPGAIAPGARASLGYEPASPASISVAGEVPQQVAIDQSSQTIYVAIPITHIGASPGEVKLGQIDQLTSTGAPTAASPFGANQNRAFEGVAVNPATHGIYAAEMSIETPIGTFGTPGRIDEFSSSGSPGTEFLTGVHVNEIPRIAADSSGRVFVPSPASGSVLVFNSTGTLQETVTCGACAGGAFQRPTAAALDSADDLYVVDAGNDRVLKLTHSGGPYVYSSTLQSGKHAAAVAVDPSNDSVFVGDYPSGGYHILAYNSSGARFDDFGAHMFAPVELGPEAAGQIAVNEANHRLYASDPGANQLRVFDLVTINPPTATTNAASPVGQIEATMNASVNANLHATVDCHFEYTDDASFQANGFTGSSQAPCSLLPDGSATTSVHGQASTLSPDTAYHYRVIATNDAGSATGSAVEFTTLPEVPPTVATETPVNVTPSTAALKGKVNPHGGTVTSCQFEYGATQSYGKSLACPGAIGITSADVAKSAILGGLAPSTSYHYRFSVTTNAGTAHGVDVEFTTLAPPPPEEPNPEEGGSGGSASGGGSGGQPPPVTTPPTTTPKRLTCRKGFRKRRVHGKLRCVKKRRRRK